MKDTIALSLALFDGDYTVTQEFLVHSGDVKPLNPLSVFQELSTSPLGKPTTCSMTTGSSNICTNTFHSSHLFPSCKHQLHMVHLPFSPVHLKYFDDRLALDTVSGDLSRALCMSPMERIWTQH